MHRRDRRGPARPAGDGQGRGGRGRRAGARRGFSDETDPEKRKFLARAKFAEFKDRQVQKRKLKGGAAFEKVWTPRQRDPQAKGKAYVYFYPQGQADRAQIPVSDGTNAYTVMTQPLTGRARVVTGIPEAPR